MRRFAAVAVLSVMLAAAPTYAQTPAPAQPAPAGQQPAPKPAQPAMPPAQTAPAPAPRPFPEGAKIAFIDLGRIFVESGTEKTVEAKVQALNQKKQQELNEKNKVLQGDQQKLQSGLSVMSDAAQAELQKKIERQKVELERAAQDAQREVQELQRELEIDFQRKLLPIVQQVSQEKGLHVLFSAAAGIAWIDPALDITPEVIKRYDAPAPAAKPAPGTKPPVQ